MQLVQDSHQVHLSPFVNCYEYLMFSRVKEVIVLKLINLELHNNMFD